MQEYPWRHGLEEYQAVQRLVSAGKHREALDQAYALLLSPSLGRRYKARLHTMVCRLHLERLHQPAPAAILHGEEAARLATVARDPWVKCDALSWLVVAYCQTGAHNRAADTCQALAAEVKRNPAALSGGPPFLYLLWAKAEAAGEQWERALCHLHRAGVHLDGERERAEWLEAAIAMQRAEALLELGHLREANAALGQPRTARAALRCAKTAETALTWSILRAWAVVCEGRHRQAERLLGPVIRRARDAGDIPVLVQCMALQARLAEKTDRGRAVALGRQALQRAVSMGRRDLARSLRRRLGHLLEAD